ncbi:E1 DerP2 DerF2 domain containing protein [Trichuris trichiura]|uniref:E1 DerP2 DerF2 domain containing protein n=1 Tax=Trichuris trichiura TaxID=36087 RepID=A0A077ZES0_TRITR|nr:E1 DerP2 DerF2 domain containing protein [Trichuris trichiura]
MYVGGQYVQYSNCGSRGNVLSVQLVPCDDPSNCTLVRGKNSRLIIQFIPSTLPLHDSTPEQLGGLARSIKLPIPSGCKKNANVCNKGWKQVVTFETDFIIRKNLPKVSVAVRFVLLDQYERELVCVRMNAHVDDNIDLNDLRRIIKKKNSNYSNR